MSTLAQPAIVTGSLRPRWAVAFSFPALLTVALVVIIFLMTPKGADDPDIWWHMRNVDVELAQRGFVRADHYAYTTAGMPWINHEWLAEVPFYAGYRVFGTPGLVAVRAVVIEGIFLGLFVLCWRKSGQMRSAFVITPMAALFSTVSFGPRTLLFGWLALVVELLLLEAFAARRPGSGRRLEWGLPLLFAVWVNTHGSWFIGLLLLVGFVVSGWWSFAWGRLGSDGWTLSERRSLLRAVGWSLPALFANPYGWRLVAYPLDLAFRQRLNVEHVDEWKSLDFHALRGHAFLVALLLFCFAQLRRERRWTPFELLLVAASVYGAFTYTRFLFLAAILLAPLMARELPARTAHAPSRNKPLLNAACMLVLGAMAAHHALPEIENAGERAIYPVEAQSYLAGFHPQGNVLNDFLWGGYLEWHDRQIPIFIDSRVDIFEYKGVLLDYLHIIAVEDSLALLDKYKIRYVLFERNTALVYLLMHTPGWKIDYQDKTTILLERTAAHG